MNLKEEIEDRGASEKTQKREKKNQTIQEEEGSKKKTMWRGYGRQGQQTREMLARERGGDKKNPEKNERNDRKRGKIKGERLCGVV